MDFLGFETEDSSDLSDSSMTSSTSSMAMPISTKPGRSATVASDAPWAERKDATPPGSPGSSIFPGSPIMPRSASIRRDPMARVLTPERTRTSLSHVEYSGPRLLLYDDKPGARPSSSGSPGSGKSLMGGGSPKTPSRSLQERIGHVKQHRTVNLNLDGCSRHFLAPDILDLDFLVTLSLCDNELQLLPPQIGSLKKLRRLLLSNNCFAEVPEVLSRLPALRVVDLSKNKLTSLPENMAVFSLLEQLNLSYNQITSLPPAVSTLKRLTLLDVSNNVLAEIPSEIGNMNLEHFSLAYNRLRRLPTTMGLLQNLISMDISHNLLVFLPSELGELIYCLKELKLVGNPLSDPLPQLAASSTSELLTYLKEHQAEGIQQLYDLRKLRYTSLDISQFLNQPEDDGKKVLKVRAQTRVGEGEKRLEIGGEFDMKFKKPQVGHPLIQACRGWYIESGRTLTEAEAKEREFDTRAFNSDYENLFLERAKADFIGAMPENGPVIVSVVKEVEKLDTRVGYRILVRTRTGDQRAFLLADALKGQKMQGIYPTSKALLKAFVKARPEYKTANLKLVVERTWPKAYRDLERRMTLNCIAVGVLYAKEGQTKPNEMIANLQPSKDFEEFLSCIGEYTLLKVIKWMPLGFQGYSAGLDVDRDTNGTHCFTAKYAGGYEFAFHVAAMMPCQSSDAGDDFSERVRLLENDICLVVFCDGTKTPVLPSEFKCNPNHVLFVVQVDRSRADGVYYKLSIAYRDGVTVPSPPLQEPAVFLRGPDFKNWLLLKLINAERGAYASPHFLKPIQNMRHLLIEELVNNYTSAAQNILA